MKFYIGLMFLFSTSAYAENALDLKSAEERVLQYSFSQKADEANVRVQHENVMQKYGEIFPTLNFDLRTPIHRHHRHFRPSSDFRIEVPIPYTPQWSQEKQALVIAQDLATKTANLDRQTLLNDVRKLYFHIQFLEQKKTLTLQGAQLVEQFKKESKQRYNQGFISRLEMQRSELDALNIEKAIEAVNIDLDSSKHQLLLLMGSKESNVILKQELTVSANFLKVTELDLRKILTEEQSEKLAITKLQVESASKLSDAAKYKYFPTLSARAEFPLRHRNHEDDLHPRYSAQLTWNLFNGGVDRSVQRQRLEAKIQAEYLDDDSKLQFDTSAEQIIGTLLKERNSYLKQKEGLKMWKDILTDNQKRFQKGHVSSKDISDDIGRYLEYVTQYYLQTYTVVSNISEFCLLIGKEDLFYDWMS